MEVFRLASRVRPPGYSVGATLPRRKLRVTSGSSAPEPSRSVPGTPGTPGTPGDAVSEAPSGALKVPWRVVRRSESGVIEIAHCGEAPLRGARCILAGGGLLGLSLPRTVYPGERLRVVVRGVNASGAIDAPDAMLVLRWFEANGTEMLWPIAV